MIEVDLAKTVPGFALDIAFRNEAGITALFGRSGAGKSMTLGLLAGLMRPDRGHVRVDGRVLVDLPRVDVPKHKRRVGLVFQDSHLFPHLSVKNNLCFGQWFGPKGARVVTFDAVIETLGLAALLSRRPAGLSGGERQRVAIGRALLASPQLLLFDEPLAALDRQRRLEILSLIERLRDAFAIPIIYVSHAIDEVARLAAHVVVLEHGKVTAAGDPAAVFGPAQAVEEPRFGRVSVLDAIVGEADAGYGLCALRHPAGTLWMAGSAGDAGRKVRVVVRATDVGLAVEPPGATSIRSTLVGTIADLEEQGPFAVVEVALYGGGTLVALVTRRAVDDLGLRAGRRVHAMVKTVALDEAMVARGD